MLVGQRIRQLVADLQMIELLPVSQEIENKNFHRIALAADLPSPRTVGFGKTRFNQNPDSPIVGARNLPQGVKSDGNERSAELPRRRAGSRPLTIRGRPVMHRSAGLAWRRSRQGGKPERRRA